MPLSTPPQELSSHLTRGQVCERLCAGRESERLQEGGEAGARLRALLLPQSSVSPAPIESAAPFAFALVPPGSRWRVEGVEVLFLPSRDLAQGRQSLMLILARHPLYTAGPTVLRTVSSRSLASAVRLLRSLLARTTVWGSSRRRWQSAWKRLRREQRRCERMFFWG